MSITKKKIIQQLFNYSPSLFLIVYLCSHIPPSIFPPLYINELFIGASIIVIPILIVISLFINKIVALIYVALLLLFLPFYTASFSFSSEDITTSDLSVLSFNTSYFRVFSTPQEKYRLNDTTSASSKITKWVSTFEGDVMCFQEYFYDKNAPMFTTTDQFREQGFVYHYISSDDPSAGFFSKSVAIFSRFPIVNQGEIFVDKNLYNRGIYADIKKGNDTIRIINTHFHSNEFDKTAHKLNLFKQYVVNSVTRGEQAQKVMNVIKTTKHPIILCGDFNQTIFSYTYQHFNNVLNNAFEVKGNGIGATLNSEKLFFLRIDHQFSSSELKVDSYEIKKEMKLSHHFPLVCTYSFK